MAIVCNAALFFHNRNRIRISIRSSPSSCILACTRTRRRPLCDLFFFFFPFPRFSFFFLVFLRSNPRNPIPAASVTRPRILSLPDSPNRTSSAAAAALRSLPRSRAASSTIPCPNCPGSWTSSGSRALFELSPGRLLPPPHRGSLGARSELSLKKPGALAVFLIGSNLGHWRI